jgi:hypothetical protein
VLSRLKAVFACLLATLLISACGDGSQSGDIVNAVAKDQTSSQAKAVQKANVRGYALSTAIWKQTPIDVCWNLDDADFAKTTAERNWSRLAVEETWVANSGVEFRGWERCANLPNFNGIRISVDDNADLAPHTTGIGNRLSLYDPGMVLNFTFNNWSTSCRTRLEFCIRTIAVHEFGHALGFAHEQARPDTPATCDQPGAGSSGDTMIGAWDLASVMNYCNPVWNGNGKLSATDIEMVQKFYGLPDQNKTLYVMTRATAPAKISAIDAKSYQPVATIALTADKPYELASHMIANPNGKYLYVLLTGSTLSTDNTLVTIDTATNAVIRKTPYASTMFSTWGNTEMMVSPDGTKLVLVERHDYRMQVFDATSGEFIKQVALPFWRSKPSQAMAMSSADNDSVYLLSNDNANKPWIYKVSIEAGAVVRSYSAGYTAAGDSTRFAIRADSVYAVLGDSGFLRALDLNSGFLYTYSVSFRSSFDNLQIGTTDYEFFFSDNPGGLSTPTDFYRFDAQKREFSAVGSAAAGSKDTLLFHDLDNRSLFFLENGRNVMELRRQIDGSYAKVDTGARTFTDGSPYYPHWFPFAVTRRKI